MTNMVELHKPNQWYQWTTPIPADPRANTLAHCLRQVVAASEAGFGGCGDRLGLYFIQTKNWRTTLFLRPNPTKWRLDYGVGGGDEEVRAEKPRWEELLKAATDLLTRTPARRWYWATILVPDPHRASNHPFRLRNSATLGQVNLFDADLWIDKPTPGSTKHPVGGCWPVLASGTIDMHERVIAEDHAYKTIQELCALLSLSWSGHIGYEDWNPVFFPGVTPGVDVPLDDARHKLKEMASQSVTEPPPGQERDLPRWAEHAWPRMPKREGTALAGAYTAGLRHFHAGQHSAASMFFHSVLDTLGKGDSSSKRVISSINRVLGNGAWDIARRIASETYGARSEIAHAGRLLGYDSQLGMRSRTTSIMPDPTYEFVIRVDLIRQICRARLLQIFNAEPYPDSSKLVERWNDIRSGAVFMGDGI